MTIPKDAAWKAGVDAWIKQHSSDIDTIANKLQLESTHLKELAGYVNRMIDLTENGFNNLWKQIDELKADIEAEQILNAVVRKSSR